MTSFFPKSKKGISPIIAVILLLMMTVAVAGAAFFWLSRIQGQMQGGVESFQGQLFETIASSIDVIDADFNVDGENLTIFFQNQGNTKVPLTKESSFPTTTWILKDSEQIALCSSNWAGSGFGDNKSVDCIEGCGSNEEIEVGEIKKVVLSLSANKCDIHPSFDNGEVFSFIVDFSGKTTTAGSFVK